MADCGHARAVHAVVEDLHVAVGQRGHVVLVVHVRRAVLPGQRARLRVDDADAAVVAAGEQDVAVVRHVEAVGVGPGVAALQRADRVAPRVEQLPEVPAAQLLARWGRSR